MKNLILISVLALFSAGLQAQNPKFVAAMQKVLSVMDTAGTAAQWQDISNSFERIGQKESKEWLPAYYVAFSQMMLFYQEKNPANKEALLNKADQFLAKADSLQPNNSEIYVLNSMIAGGRIQLNPMVNGQKYGPLAGMYITKATELDPENPRAYMQQGISVYFTPPQWGGDKVKGKELLETAMQKFETFKPASAIHPAWGKATTAKYLEMARKG